MKTKIVIVSALIGALLVVASSVAMAGSAESNKPASLVAAVRQATTPFKDVNKATAAGYGLFHGCTSSAQEGAMGIHFANGNLVGDGALDAAHPEVLMYEPKNGKLELLGVEYLVLADAWNAKNDAPPVLMGQMFNFVGAPNRYRLPAFYELHVWAWKSNPSGVFADFNTRVSCEDFNGDMAHH